MEEGLIREEGLLDQAALYHTLKDWVKAEGLGGKKAILSLPSFHTFVRKVKVPEMKEKELNRYLELEIQSSLYLPFEDPLFDFVLEEKEEGKDRKAVLYVTPRKIVEAYLEVLEELGLRVLAVDLPALSLLRLLHWKGVGLEENMMLLFLTEKTLDIHMFYREIPEFMRTAPLQQEEASIGQGLAELRWNDTLSEVRRMLNFYQFNMHEEEKMVTQLFLLGDNPDKEGFRKRLEDEFVGIRIESLRFASPGGIGPEHEIDAYAMPFGLALRGVKG